MEQKGSKGDQNKKGYKKGQNGINSKGNELTKWPLTPPRHTDPHPDNGRPSGPTGHGASRPGRP